MKKGLRRSSLRTLLQRTIPTADLMKKGLRLMGEPKITIHTIPTADLMKKGLRLGALRHLSRSVKFQPQT